MCEIKYTSTLFPLIGTVRKSFLSFVGMSRFGLEQSIDFENETSILRIIGL